MQWDYGDVTLRLSDDELSWESTYDDCGRILSSVETQKVQSFLEFGPAVDFDGIDCSVPADVLSAVLAAVGAKQTPSWTAPLAPPARELLSTIQYSGRLQPLLAGGADPNVSDRRGHSPLFLALRNGAPASARLLLESGADANRIYRTPRGAETALGTAVNIGDAELVRMLVDRGASPAPGEGVEPMLPRVRKGAGAVRIVEDLLRAGADPNEPPALFSIVRGGAMDAVPVLLKAGARADAADAAGRTPLFAACGNGPGAETSDGIDLGVAQLLVRAGASVQARDAKQETPLMWAARARVPDIVRWLLSEGADPRVISDYGATPVGLAAQRDVPSTRLLLDAGAPLHGGDEKGNTPLHGACWLKDEAWLEELLARGADVTARNCAGEDVVSAASKSGWSFALIRLESAVPPASARHMTCSICSQIQENEHGFQCGAHPEDNTYIPAAAKQLTAIRRLKPEGCRYMYLQRCPQCATFYFACDDWEYYVSGTEDEQALRRLDEAGIAKYIGWPIAD